MSKKKTSRSWSSSWYEDQDNFKWCIENDFKVYITPIGHNESQCKIVVQRGGITTEGKESKIVNGRLRQSKSVESTETYKNQKLAQEALPSVWKMLREKYGK